MSEVSIADHLARLNIALQGLETRTARTAVPVEELSDVKRALDDLRLRVWALLKAPHDHDPASFEERFRARRATELCSRLTADLRAGLLNPRHGEYADLWIAGKDLSQAIHAARAEPAPGA